MATKNFWSKVAVAVQSALGAAKTITGLTNANPGVATSVAHGLSNGNYLLYAVQGMYQVDQRVIRVANKTNDTWELEGVNTTSFGTFSSGSAQAITFGTTLSTAVDINSSGGDPKFEDTTTIHDAVESQVPVVASAQTITMNNIWDPSDAGLIALKAASDALSALAFKFTFASGAILVFYGYVSAPLIPTGSAQKLVTTPVTITVARPGTAYAA